MTVSKGGSLSKGLFKFIVVLVCFSGIVGILYWTRFSGGQKFPKETEVADGALKAPSKIPVSFYLPKKDLSGLAEFSFELEDQRSDLSSWVNNLLWLLSSTPNDLVVPIFSEDTQIRSVFLDESQVFYLDLPSSAVSLDIEGVELELLALEACLTTLQANLPTVTKVKILVNGDDVETLRGHVDLMRFFSLGRK